MHTITVTLSDEQQQRLRELSARHGIPVEALVRLGIDELLRQPDEAFRKAADYVLKKNNELYRRLA